MWPWHGVAKTPSRPVSDDVEADIRTGRVLARLETVTERFESIAERIERRMNTEEPPSHAFPRH